MASTQPVNFRADSAFYEQTKEIIADEKITLSDVFNAALRKIATGQLTLKNLYSVILRKHNIKLPLKT